MEDNVLQKNLLQISKYNKELADRIAAHTELNHNIELVEAESGDPVLSFDGLLLHDMIDPQDEALNIFYKISKNKKNTIHVLFGLGIGYLFKRFAMSCKGKIIVYEPNLDILRITFELVDFSEELGRNNIAVVDQKEDVQKCFDRFFFGEADITLSFLKSYSRLYQDEIHNFAEELSFVSSLYGTNYKNLFKSCHMWTISGIRSLSEVVKHNELESLRDKFENIPAVIISAGPSLTKNIDILKDYKDKVITFCVGTALKTAAEHDIEPDFLTVVESQDCSGQVIGVDVSNMNVILHPATFEYFHRMPAKRHFNYYPNNDFTTKWLANLIDISLKDYYNKGTVSICALFSAMIMGCNPIILIGQDLAYSNGKCYSSGSQLQDLVCVKNEKTGKFEIQVTNSADIAELIDPDHKYDHEGLRLIMQKRFEEMTENLYTVKGHNGEMLPTEACYATFIRYFENTASEFGDKVKFINSTEGGAYLEGFEHMPLKSALDTYAAKSVNVEAVIQDSLKSARNLLKEKGQLVLDEIEFNTKLFEESFEYFEAGKTFTEKIIKLEKLNRIHSDEFKENCKDALANFLVIEQRILQRSSLLIGLIYPEYSKLSHYLQNCDDNIDMDSIQKFIELLTDFFINAYSHFKEDLNWFRTVRVRLHQNKII